MGKLPASKSCASHKADAFTLVGESHVPRLKKIADGIRDLSVTEIQALAAVLNAERITRKYGWKFYQKVYVRYTGNSSSNYFSNFAVGFVVSADKEHVRIVGNSGKVCITALNTKGDTNTTVFTIDEFKKLSASMLKKRAFVDPASTIRAVVARVQPIDDAVESAEPLNRKLVKSKTRTEDLVAIIAKMGNGFGLKPRAHKASAKGKSKSREIVMDWR